MKDTMKNIQFRSPKVSTLPSWTAPTYNDWADCEVTETYKELTFPRMTEFRVKPLNVFLIRTDCGKEVSCNNQDETMSRVSKFVTEGLTVTVKKTELESPQSVQSVLAGKNVQWRTIGDNWQHLTSFRSQGYEWPLRLRVRPDYFHRVTTLSPASSSTVPVSGVLEFTDIEDLKKYVDNRISTNGLDFQVTKVKYAV